MNLKTFKFRSSLERYMSDFIIFKRQQNLKAEVVGKRLRLFDTFLYKRDFKKSYLNREIIDDYSLSVKDMHRITRYGRLNCVRQFSLYLHGIFPKSYVMRPVHIKTNSKYLPYIFTKEEIKTLIVEAGKIACGEDPLRSCTYQTLIGLLYVTGARIGEILALNAKDVLFQDRLIFIRRGKFGKDRWIPILESTADALKTYFEKRNLLLSNLDPESPFFVNLHHNSRTNRLSYQAARVNIVQIMENANIRKGNSKSKPRIHDLRHSFAIHRLLEWYENDADINAKLPTLATFLGHIQVASTIYYLKTNSELFAKANQKFAKNFRQNILNTEA